MTRPKQSTSKQPPLSMAQIGTVSTLITLGSGLGAGVSAAMRGGEISDIVESASVAGLGAGSFITSMGLASKFGFFKDENAKPLSTTDQMLIPATITLVGAAIGYAGAKLFIDAAVSTAPLTNAVLGMPVSVGTIYCLKLLLDACCQNSNAPDAPRLQ